MATISSVADLIKHHAETRGQQIAFSGSSGRAVTYAQLAVRTSRIAERLIDRGTARGHRVALVLGSCVEAVESLVSITRAAAIGVPLDARSSQVELTRAFEKSRASLVITDDRRLGKVLDAVAAGKRRPGPSMIVVVVGGAPECLDSGSKIDSLAIERYEDWAGERVCSVSGRPPPLLDSLGLDEPAWLHFTTGTTGQPKGVLTCQRGWMWTAVNSYIPSLRFSSTDKLFWPLPLFHAFAQTVCLTGTLAVGASTHLLGDEPLLDSLSQHPETTIIAGAPATYREIVANSSDRPALSLLRPRACLSAGAPAPAGLSAQVEALFGVPLINHYGCTECNLVATTGPGDVYRQDSCGLPPAGVQVQVQGVSPDGSISGEVADGEEGEICVRTPSFMLGYDNGSDEPQRPLTDDGWYRTGDLGRRIVVESGTAERPITVTGRLKELVIRGGENIHPAEVERALRTCPDVVDVVVTGLPHESEPVPSTPCPVASLQNMTDIGYQSARRSASSIHRARTKPRHRRDNAPLRVSCSPARLQSACGLLHSRCHTTYCLGEAQAPGYRGVATHRHTLSSTHRPLTDGGLDRATGTGGECGCVWRWASA